MEKEVSNILGFRWHALSDKEFKIATINPTSSYNNYDWLKIISIQYHRTTTTINSRWYQFNIAVPNYGTVD
jgi:hypothetical protein